jgi:hypothetical protein
MAILFAVVALVIAGVTLIQRLQTGEEIFWVVIAMLWMATALINALTERGR